jgi:profilin
MSGWQAYVDSSLVGTGCVTFGAIVGFDGSVWAISNGFPVSADEVKKLNAAFSAPGSIQENGFMIAKEKYRALNASDRSIYGRLGSKGVVCCKTNQCIIIAHYNENIQPGQCTNATEKLADYLRDQGY